MTTYLSHLTHLKLWPEYVHFLRRSQKQVKDEKPDILEVGPLVN